MTDPNVYGGTWYAATQPAIPARPPLTGETDVDVCVVGGGLAGLTVARELARRGWSVALLEARRIAWAASGRNTGFVLPGFGADPEDIVTRVGLEHARALWALSVAGAEYVRNSIRELRMPGVDYGAGGWLHVSKTDNDAEVERRATRIATYLGGDVEFWPAERVRATLRSPRYFSAVNYRRAFTINPLSYTLGLAAAAEAAGARIYEMTPVVGLDPGGVRKRITTPTTRLRAGHVVLAGNAGIGGLMPRLARTLLPVSTYVLVTAPLGDRLREAVGYRGGISDTDLANNHYRVVAGDRLMWSGRSTTWEGRPHRRVRALLEDIRRAYPQLGEVTAEHAWVGTLGIPVHRMPQIGELSPGVWLASGFGGHGLNTTAMAGELIARAIVEGDQSWRLFAPFELVWAGGLAGRLVHQIYAWSFGWREQWANERARRREAQRSRQAVAPEAAAPSVVPADESGEEEPVAVAAKRTRRRKRLTRPKRRKAPIASSGAATGPAAPPVAAEGDDAAADTAAASPSGKSPAGGVG